MATELKKEIELEIAHVLLDIVGYSKLSVNEQHDYLHTLNEVVRRTDSFRTAIGPKTKTTVKISWIGLKSSA